MQIDICQYEKKLLNRINSKYWLYLVAVCISVCRYMHIKFQPSYKSMFQLISNKLSDPRNKQFQSKSRKCKYLIKNYFFYIHSRLLQKKKHVGKQNNNKNYLHFVSKKCKTQSNKLNTQDEGLNS